MKRYESVKRLSVLLAAAVISMAAAFVSEPRAVSNTEVPVTLHLDMNSRKTSIYDGYSSYLLGNRVSEIDTFIVTRDNNNVNLDDVILNYYLITYGGNTQKYLECTVYGLKEGQHYPVIRPETVERETASGQLYENLERSYMVELMLGDAKKQYYFLVYPESEMNEYRNILLGKWVQSSAGWQYRYQDENLTSWALINGQWYYFGTDGIMKTGWQEYKGQWFYLDPESGVMRSNCRINGYELDSNGVRI